MFDKLVESTKTKTNYRGGRIFFLTGLVYAALLTTLGVWTILGLNPGLAESFDLTKLAPPVPIQAGPPPVNLPNRTVPQAAPSFRPADPNTPIPNPTAIPSLSPIRNDRVIYTGSPTSGDWAMNLAPAYVPGAGGNVAPPPPPPAPKPTPDPVPEAKPTPRQVMKISDGVTKGLAIHRVTPAYPAIARAAHAFGAVQIQVLISEEGRVLDADVINGPPLLRQAALDAARQWVFRPTLLSNVPVKVQGVLTFNFTLN
ncbi:MAG: TonB family protein [Acidobacteria bacterium]|nr:TonB family protein [Acidobacteriota bacterium]MBI3425864.1 TonB family protein [Acidobacteriota bacterium]